MIYSDYAKKLNKRLKKISLEGKWMKGEYNELIVDIFEYISHLEDICAEWEPEPQEWSKYDDDE